MFDIDALYYRTSLNGGPISLLVRFVPHGEVVATVRNAVELLRHRPQFDEIMLLVDPSAPMRLPAKIDGKRIRLLVRERPDSGETLADAFSLCLHPSIVVIDGRLSADADELAAMLDRLEHADLVCATRPIPRRRLIKTALTIATGVLGGAFGQYLSGWQAPVAGFVIGASATLAALNFAAIVRWCFGIPVRDPACPVKALRKPAVDGIVLQCDDHLTDLELIAKLTYLTTLMDEAPIRHADGPATLIEAVGGQWIRLLRVALAPRFWAFDPASPRFRPILHEKPAAAASPAPIPYHPAHQERQSWGPAYPKDRLVSNGTPHALLRDRPAPNR